TANIDRIAHEGVRFRNAFCTTPLCSPARASLLTGLYTHHHGILDNTDRSVASHKLMTFPRVLQKAGYETAYIGKWHMGNDATARPGFHYWVGMQGQGTSFDPILNVNGRHIRHTGHTTDVLNEKAVAFVRKKRKKPYCLYLAHKVLHPELVQYNDGSLSDPTASRFMPANRHKNMYADETIPRRPSVDDSLAGKPALRQKIEGLQPLSRKTGTSDETVRDRLRMLAAVDEGVGMLFKALEDSGQLDDTVLVFLSDHGYWYGEHGLSVERRLAYEEGIRIPLLVSYPRLIKGGRTIDEFALGVDLAPTLIELARRADEHRMDGSSLGPLLREQTPKEWRTSFLIEYNTDTVFPRMRNMGYRAVRTKDWKYIRYNKLRRMDELYDLKNDPYEMQNLIDDPSSQEVLKELKRVGQG
ncbi:sulfatase-like hydrolase/transferase, partial [Acidobacteria bacterium AH-259-L09]|nr:sulfatase-like hydrolase/transferase [Acidobacteria bacterium AH-259-L09]